MSFKPTITRFRTACLFTSGERAVSLTLATFDKNKLPSRMGGYFLSYNQSVMDNKGLPAIEGSGEKLDRRNFLKGSLGTLAMATIAGTTGLAKDVLAQEVKTVSAEKTVFEYVPSKLGIDYYQLADSPMAEILSQGEGEWMENATSKYGSKTARFWEKSISKKVATGAISGSIIEKLREFTPDMLTKFTALDPQDPKYGGLWSVGTNYVSEKFAGKV